MMMGMIMMMMIKVMALNVFVDDNNNTKLKPLQATPLTLMNWTSIESTSQCQGAFVMYTKPNHI